jgi:hypothetical protein
MNKNNYSTINNLNNYDHNDQKNKYDNIFKQKIKYSDKDIERNDEELLKPEKYNIDLSYQLRFNMDYSKIIPAKDNLDDNIETTSKFFDNNTYMTQNIKRIPLDTTNYLNPQNMVSRGFSDFSYPDNYGLYTRQLQENSNPRSIIYENRNFQTNSNLLYSNYIDNNNDRGGKDTRYLNKKSFK